MPQSTHSAVSRCEGIYIPILKDTQQLPGNNTSTLYLVTSADRKLSETNYTMKAGRKERKTLSQIQDWNELIVVIWHMIMCSIDVCPLCTKIDLKNTEQKAFKQHFRQGWNCASHPGQEHQANALWRRLICSALILSKYSLWHLTFIPDNRKPNFLHQAHTKREKSNKRERHFWTLGLLTWH